VDHSCYQCGAAVDEGVPFCPSCRAPQIRVAGGLAALEALPTVVSAAPRPIVSASAAQSRYPARNRSQSLAAVTLAALVTAFFMTVPLGSFVLGMLSCGALSVAFYRRRNPAANLTPGAGARLGALSGLLGFGVLVVLLAAQLALFRSGGQIRQTLLQAVQQAAAGKSDPAAQQALQFLNTPQGFVSMVIVGLAFVLVVFVALACAGGVIGAKLLRDHLPASSPGYEQERVPAQASETRPTEEKSHSA
jgi:hypothetical protein